MLKMLFFLHILIDTTVFFEPHVQEVHGADLVHHDRSAYCMISSYLLGQTTSVGVTQPDNVVTSVIGVSSTTSSSHQYHIP